MDIIDMWVNLPYQLYTWQSVQAITDANPFAVAFMFLVLVFGVGMGNELTNMLLQKKEGVLEIICVNGMLKVAPTDEDGRIFNPVPGFSFVPLQIFPEGENKKIQIEITYN